MPTHLFINLLVAFVKEFSAFKPKKRDKFIIENDKSEIQISDELALFIYLADKNRSPGEPGFPCGKEFIDDLNDCGRVY